jgi:hypothetical protein
VHSADNFQPQSLTPLFHQQTSSPPLKPNYFFSQQPAALVTPDNLKVSLGTKQLYPVDEEI